MKRFVYMLLAVLILTAVACTHKELCYDHGHYVNLEVRFDWSNAPEAEPETMSFYIFSENGRKPERYELLGHNGGVIKLNVGRYHAICLNSDTKNIECRDKESLSTFLITTKDDDGYAGLLGAEQLFAELVPQGDGPNRAENGERIAREPEQVWIGSVHDFEVTQEGENIVTMSPVERVVTIRIIIRNVQNIRNISSLAATISGLSEGVLGSSGECNGVPVTHPLIFSPMDETTIGATLRSFGDCRNGDEEHHITLYMGLVDGSHWKYNANVTEQVHSAEDKALIEIVLDELPVPEVDPGFTGDGGGFSPTIEEWTSVNIGLTM